MWERMGVMPENRARVGKRNIRRKRKGGETKEKTRGNQYE